VSRFYTDDEVRRRSVVEITSPTAFDPLTGTTPLPCGLYDARMGPLPPQHGSVSIPCRTCARSYHDCPGHGGHLELVVPVHHPLLLSEVLAILKCQCRYCGKFRAVPRLVTGQAAKLVLLATNRLDELAAWDAQLASLQAAARNTTNSTSSSSAQSNNPTAAANRASAAALDAYLQSILQPSDMDASSSSVTVTSSFHATQFLALKKETLALLKSAKRCAQCGAYSPPWRHDAHNKLFRAPLSNKLQKLNDAQGIVATAATAAASSSTSRPANTADGSDGVATTANGYDSDDTAPSKDSEEMNDEEEEDSVAPMDDDSDEGENDDEQNDDEEAATTTKPAKSDTYVPTSEIQAVLQQLWQLESTLCTRLFGDWRQYILQCIAVPPNRFRPPMSVSGNGGGSGGTMLVEHAQTAALAKILTANATVRDRMAAAAAAVDHTAKAAATAAVYPAWIALQTAVNVYMDASQDPAVGRGGTAVPVAGIRQMLERKEGLFRKHMMGKRVDYACRSVISPDPYIGTNEIGIPLHFCRVLTYPTPVTERNVAELRRLVERGPHDYPGARWVELSSTGPGSSSSLAVTRRRVDLSKMKPHQRQAIAAQLMLQHARSSGVVAGVGPVVVGRQLRDGDYVLMNRQVRFCCSTMLSRWHAPFIVGPIARVAYVCGPNANVRDVSY
jgi:DNA-directed RNA polymerase I subunit RPA1